MNAVIVWFVIGVACLLGELFTISFVLFFFRRGGLGRRIGRGCPFRS